MAINTQEIYQHLADMRRKVIAANGVKVVDNTNKQAQKSEREFWWRNIFCLSFLLYVVVVF